MNSQALTPPNPSGGPPRRVPRRGIVRSIEQLSPHMRRITFEHPDLATFAWSGPAAHIKIVPPDPGSDVAPIPIGDGPRPASMRTYTPRRFDAATRTLVVDFVLHGEGPASVWAASARVGQQITIVGPGRSYTIYDDDTWYLFLCDPAALPAIETILEALPEDRAVTVFVEITDLAEKRELSSASRADVRWLVRAPDAVPGSALEAELATFVYPASNGRVYAGTESDAVRRLRSSIVDRSGLDGERVVTRGYWRVGVRNNPDHDYAEG